MSLRSYTRMNSGVAVVEFEGSVTLGEATAHLRDTVTQVIMQGHASILIDLEDVSYIDSAGLGELVGCHGLARARGAVIKLVHLQKKVEGLMQITKLTTVFETFEDESVAVRSFGQASSAQA